MLSYLLGIAVFKYFTFSTTIITENLEIVSVKSYWGIDIEEFNISSMFPRKIIFMVAVLYK